MQYSTYRLSGCQLNVCVVDACDFSRKPFFALVFGLIVKSSVPLVTSMDDINR